MEAMTSVVSRIFFIGAFALMALAVTERLSNALGYTILREQYTASRLLEIAVVALIFVLALVLREVRDELRKRNS